MQKNRVSSPNFGFHLGWLLCLLLYPVLWVGSYWLVIGYNLYPSSWANEQNVAVFPQSSKNILWTQVIVGIAITLLLVCVFIKGVIRLINKQLVSLRYEQIKRLQNSIFMSHAWQDGKQPVVMFDLISPTWNAFSFAAIICFTIISAGLSLGQFGQPKEHPSFGGSVLGLIALNFFALYAFSFVVITNSMVNYLYREYLIASGRYKDAPPIWLVWLGKSLVWLLFAPLYLLADIADFVTFRLSRIRDMSNPYAKALEKSRSQSQSKPYDTFISYSSFDVLRARHITEQLIAGGRLPWFAEYCIGVHLWTKDENDLNQLLDDGLQRSHSGVVFSSHHYEKSVWCLKEVIAVDEPVAVLECSPLASETSEVANALKQIPAAQKMPYSTINESLEHICKVLKWKRIQRPSVNNNKQDPILHVTSGGSVRLNGWKHVADRQGNHGNLERAYQRFFGIHAATLTILDGGVAGDQIPYKDGVVDDRLYREYLIEFVRNYSGKTNVDVAGAHLLFVGDRGHFATTYRYGKAWIRKYSLNFPLDSTGRTWECAFTFGFHGPFRAFCRYAWCFDEVVQSFERKPSSIDAFANGWQAQTNGMGVDELS